MDPRFLLSIFSILRGKGMLLILILGVVGYFAFTKYGDQIVQQYPELRFIKENIEKIKTILPTQKQQE